MSAEIDKAIELLSARIMELARENATLREQLAQAKGVERRALNDRAVPVDVEVL